MTITMTMRMTIRCSIVHFENSLVLRFQIGVWGWGGNKDICGKTTFPLWIFFKNSGYSQNVQNCTYLEDEWLTIHSHSFYVSFTVSDNHNDNSSQIISICNSFPLFILSSFVWSKFIINVLAPSPISFTFILLLGRWKLGLTSLGSEDWWQWIL